MSLRLRQLAGATLSLSGLVLAGCASELTPTSSPRYLLPPPPGAAFQIQLDGGVPDDPGARIIEVDGQAPEHLVAALTRGDTYTICYMSAGTVEEYRPDAAAFPDEIVGRALPEWPDERYVDLRRLDVLGPLWEARLDECAAAGFDAVDPDNLDSFANDSGFPLTEAHAAAAAMR